jgi:hypothetical protein
VIPLRRIKWIDVVDLAARFVSVEKSPPKERELRCSRPPSRIAGREQDALAALAVVKFAQRARRNAKLRLFRIFKLFTQLKRDAAAQPTAYRPVAERMRVARFLRRL